MPKQWQIQDFPLGGMDPLGGAWTTDTSAFSVKMCAKMKELGPMGGHVPSTPPRSASAKY